MTAGLTPSQVFVVGDTPRDIDAGKAAGAVSVGVATGNYSVAELTAYFDAVRPQLRTSQSTADVAEYLLAMPDVEPELADVWQVLAAASVATLPGWARAMYGFGEGGPDPAADSVPPEREEVRAVLGVLDAVYLGEPGVLEARQRLTLRMRAAADTQAGRRAQDH